MTTATLAPLVRATPSTRPYRWTVKKFHEACEQKVWGDGKQVILIRGQLFEVPPMSPAHAASVRLVDAALRTVVPVGYFFQIQLPLVLGLETDPIPDVAVIAGQLRDFLTIHPTSAELVVEVARTSLDFDLTSKAELYATAKVPEYWVVDVANRLLVVLRDPSPIPDGGAAYRHTQTFSATDTVAPLLTPDKPIRVADLLP